MPTEPAGATGVDFQDCPPELAPMRALSIALLAVAMPLLVATESALGQAPDQPVAAELPAKLPKGIKAYVIKAEILLDRAGFSPGVIDGRGGDNFRKALVAFKRQNGLDANHKLDNATWDALAGAAQEPLLVEYEIAPEDVKG